MGLILYNKYKIVASKRKLGCASAMVLFVVEDKQMTEETDVLMWK